MMKLLLGFAAGWWVGSRQATGRPIVTPEIELYLRKAGGEGQRLLYAAGAGLTAGAPGDEAVPGTPEAREANEKTEEAVFQKVSGFRGFRRR